MGKEFNTGIFGLVRGSLGLNQSELAQKIGWTQGRVSKVEHGLIQVDEEEGRMVAECLQLPPALFFEDATAVGFGTCCQYDRKRKSTPVRKLGQLHDQLNLRRIQLGRLVKGVSLPNKLNFPDLDVDKFGSPEESARLLRATWQLPRGRIVNLVDAVESAGAIVVYCKLGIPTIDAVSQRSHGMPHMIFVDEDQPADRCRFSLSHEIGHLVMHRIPTPDAEKEADRFAAEFLMPAKEIAPDLKNFSLGIAANLKLKWRVSIQAIIRRAKDLRAITPARYKSMCVRFSQLGYRKNEPNPISPETPKTLRWILDSYMHDRGYSVRELSEAALANEEDFRRDYLTEGPRLKVV